MTGTTQMRGETRRWIWLPVYLLVTGSLALAVLTEPDNIVHGTISIGGVSMTASNTNIVVEARVATNGRALASCRLGSNAGHHPYFYSLVINMEAYVPRSDTNALQTIVSNTVYITLLNNGVVVSQRLFQTSRRGVLARRDFGPLIDADGDGLYDFEEFDWKTNPGNPDSDGDGLSDGDEVHIHHTIPSNPDTDGDGDNDGDEVRYGTDPLDPNSFLASISGDVLYGGAATGMIRVAAGLWPNRVLALDGSNDYVAISNMVYNSVGQITGLTVEAWVKTLGTNYHIVAAFDRDAAWRLTVGDNRLGNYKGYVGFDTTDEKNNIHDMRGNTLVNDGQWHHIAATYTASSGTKRIYVDGQLDNTVAAAHAAGRRLVGGEIPRYGFIGVGSDASVFDGVKNPKHYFQGKIDELRIWHRTLSQIEIQQNMRKALSGFYTDLVACWGFDDDTAADTTGHGYDGALRDTAGIGPDYGPSAKGEDVLTAPGSYSIGNLPNQTSYWVSAYRDINGNKEWDAGEPYGEYVFNPLFLLNDTIGIDILLSDGDMLLDTDGDGLPDEFELRYGLNHLVGTGDDGPDGDPDNDGVPNKDECGADTNPRDNTSYLRITDIAPAGAGLRIYWLGGTSAWQRVQHAVGAGTAAVWQTIYTDLPPTPGQNSVVSPMNGDASGWFRVQAGR